MNRNLRWSKRLKWYRNFDVIFFSTWAIVVILLFIGAYKSISTNKPTLKTSRRIQCDTIRWCKVTSYQNDPWQTDDRPNETASGVNITTDLFWSGEPYGYCAASRDLLNFHLNFYDTIYTSIEDTVYGFIVIDVMNKRYCNSIDILTDYNILQTNKIWYIKK